MASGLISEPELADAGGWRYATLVLLLVGGGVGVSVGVVGVLFDRQCRDVTNVGGERLRRRGGCSCTA